MQLGRYQVLKHLASGSIADVLLARASGLEGFARHVVIKRMKPELAKEDQVAKAFLDEARISASLNHQNIVQVHDIGEEGGSYYFAMEYIHGEDSRALLAKVRERSEHVPLEIAVAIIMAAASGLHHAHEKTSSQGEKLGIVHRDVSPSNILVGYDGSVKLVDFGLAKAAQRSTTTAAGTLKGKASYMSPEQCKGEPIDRRTDTFCLGIVLYELVTAQRLFKGPTEYATMAAVVEGEIPPPSRLRTDIPAALDAIILRALSRKQADRYQTAEDFRAAVEAFAVEYQLRTSNKALADYLTRLFGPKQEPWHDGVDVKPVDDSTFDGLRGAAVAPRAAKPKAHEPKPAPVDDDEDEDAFIDDDVKTTLMPDSDVKAIEAQTLARQNAKRTENEEYTVVEPVAFEAESDTVAEGPETITDLKKPAPPRQHAHTIKSPARGVPINAPAPASVRSATPPSAFQPLVGSGKTPPGAFQAAPMRTGNTPPGAFQAPVRTGNTPSGTYATGPRPANLPPKTFLGVGAAGPAPMYPPHAPLPADFSLSQFAGLKRWLSVYWGSVLLGGGLGVAVVIIMVIIMRGSGGDSPPAPPDAMPPDAQEVKTAPVDAAPAPEDAAKPHKRKSSSGAPH